MNEIPDKPALYNKLISKWQLRFLRSLAWSQPRREEWKRYYNRYRKIQDGIAGGDKYSIILGYAFGLVEQINSKITEPLFRMGQPFNPLPKKLGDTKSAENFAQVVRNFYTKPNQQEAIRRSKKEMIITGNRWEVDEWLHIEQKSKRWGKVPKEVRVPVMQNGRPVLDKTGKAVLSPPIMVLVDAEVESKTPTYYGFNTRYPSVFDMYPEPDKKTIATGMPTDAAWLVEDMGELALEDMAREVYVDPHDGAIKPLYDFSRLLHDKGRAAEARYEKIMAGEEVEDAGGALITPLQAWSTTTTTTNSDRNSNYYPGNASVNLRGSEDRDKVWVVRGYQGDEIITFANGKYIIQRKLNPWHNPGLKARIENYSMDPEFIYGQGALQPIEAELDELDDVHNLGMDNFIRLVNKMIAVREDAIVSMADFDHRAGGIVRMTESAGDLNSSIRPIDHGNVHAEMIAAESNAKGEIEFVSSNLDASPGVMGTRQNHKTKGGMEIIQVNINTRFITMQSQALINEARRGLSMEQIFSQFCFEKMPYRVYRDDGTTALAEFNKDDIYTEGRGFEFAIEIDPTWGDLQSQRQQDLQMYELGEGYEKMRRDFKDPEMRKLNLDKLFETILKNHGHRDTSTLFTRPENATSPEDELQILMQGGIAECRGNLQEHIQAHILQMQSPNLKKAIETGKAHPDTMKNLNLLVQQDMAKLRTFIADPQAVAMKRLNAPIPQRPE